MFGRVCDVKIVIVMDLFSESKMNICLSVSKMNICECKSE